MTCDSKTFNLPVGASFDLSLRIPSSFPDGYFAGWIPTSEVRSDKDDAIATLDVEWADIVTTRVLRLRKLDTAAWPVCAARFDVCLKAPDGTRLYTTAQAFHIVRGVTRA